MLTRAKFEGLNRPGLWVIHNAHRMPNFTVRLLVELSPNIQDDGVMKFAPEMAALAMGQTERELLHTFKFLAAEGLILDLGFALGIRRFKLPIPPEFGSTVKPWGFDEPRQFESESDRLAFGQRAAYADLTRHAQRLLSWLERRAEGRQVVYQLAAVADLFRWSNDEARQVFAELGRAGFICPAGREYLDVYVWLLHEFYGTRDAAGAPQEPKQGEGKGASESAPQSKHPAPQRRRARPGKAGDFDRTVANWLRTLPPSGLAVWLALKERGILDGPVPGGARKLAHDTGKGRKVIRNGLGVLLQTGVIWNSGTKPEPLWTLDRARLVDFVREYREKGRSDTDVAEGEE